MKISGLPGPGAAAYRVWERLKEGRRQAVVCRDLSELEELEGALEALAPLFPGVDGSSAVFTEDPLSLSPGLERLAAGAKAALVQAEVLAKPLPGRRDYGAARLVLKADHGIARSDLVNRLAQLGWRREDFAESPGEYAIRGSVTDFCLPEGAAHVRVFWDEDRVESVRSFDPATQRTEKFLENVVLAPFAPEGSSSLAEWLEGFDWLSLAPEPPPGLPEGAWAAAPSGGEDYGARANPKFQGNLSLALKQAQAWRERGWTVLLYSLNKGESERLQETLEGRLEGAQFLIGPLSRGFQHEEKKLAVLTSGEIYERSYRARLKWGAAPRRGLRWKDLKNGDYVVHHDYGIARYLGLKPAPMVAESGSAFIPAPPASQVQEEGAPQIKQELVLLEFRGGDKLFVPLWEFKKVEKYVGSGGRSPRLSSLDTKSWERVRGQVREGVRELAAEILKIEARRASRPGFAFGPATHLEQEFAASFPYEETPDQARAIAEVTEDLERPLPMNRVVIGDVGFGKTEVALRAALKCVMNARQAALLVPTTILADQHFRNFQRRLADYPVRVAMLSRFQTPAERKEVLAKLADGRADIVVGTHRLLQKDVEFKNLGLVVTDEEHRFGVGDKEKLKRLCASVHALALSATPIPRTLYQSLSGLRAISLIASPPAGRLPIVTRVAPYSEDLVASAIRAELDRGGQAYYVYNRVKSLPQCKKQLEALLPGVRFGIAHGQLDSDELEKNMWDFFERRFDVLIASSIIESGLDNPNVNTLIVEDAQDFGLAQLYQLRGRIGRERQRAYCWLLHPETGLTSEATQRLEALQEFAHLGSGFHLAMRDLEIRGAGELLGVRQHGFVAAVGLETYVELLNEEVEKLRGKGGREEEAPLTTVDLRLPAYLPEAYLPDELQRLDIYKRILAAGEEQLPALRSELEDLSGPAPEPVANLFRIAKLRLLARPAGIRSIQERQGGLEVHFWPRAEVPPQMLARWTKIYGSGLSFIRSEQGDGLRLAAKKAAVEEAEAFLLSFKGK